jgi:RNA methyltransferase, TrmH family
MINVVTKNQIKFVQSLHRKKYRQKYGQFMVEGEKSVEELIHSNYEITAIYGSPDWINEHNFKSFETIVAEASKDDLERMSFFKTASPVIAVANQKNERNTITSEWSICVDDIKDPGNLGAIIRIADWYGISTVYCSEETVDLYNPKTISSTMGSFTRVECIYGSLKDVINSSNKPAYFALMNGDSIDDYGNAAPGLIVIGGEANGISDGLMTLNHKAITIPKKGGAESLNAAIATGIICDRLVR